MTEEQACKIAEALQEAFTIGTYSGFCDEVDFDAAETNDIVKVILDNV